MPAGREAGQGSALATAIHDCMNMPGIWITRQQKQEKRTTQPLRKK